MSVRSVTCPFCSASFVPGRKARSTPHHRRFFQLIRAAYQNWPSGHSQQPTSSEVLRKWLIAEAGYVDELRISPAPGLTSRDSRIRLESDVWTRQTIQRIVAVHPDSWVKRDGKDVVIVIPRSIAFDKMSQSEFTDLYAAVAAVIYRETGLDADELVEGSVRCHV